jgi:hypothetical protein
MAERGDLNEKLKGKKPKNIWYISGKLHAKSLKNMTINVH